MRLVIKYMVLIVLMIECPPSMPAQDHSLLFENYSSLHGLSQNSCYDISQDGNGFMWFATQDGLNRYDGHEFRVYLPGNEIGKLLPSNHISSLEYDPDEKIMWVGTVRGMSLYHEKLDSIVSVSRLYPYLAELESMPVKKVVHFQKDEIWVVTQNNGLLLINLETEKVQRYFDEDGMKEYVNGIVFHNSTIVVSVLDRLFTLVPGSSHYSVNPMKLDMEFSEIKELYSFRDQLWVGTLTRGCFYIDDFGGENQVKQFEHIQSGGIGAFLTDNNGQLWIGTRGNGIVVYNPDKEEIVEAHFSKFEDHSLGRDFILSIFKDRQGIMWCGLSGGGLSKYDPLKYQFTNLHNDPLNPHSLPGNMIFEIFKSEDGTHYIGTQNKGLVRWDDENGSFYEYPYFSATGVPVNTVYDIIQDEEHSYWIATWGGLLHFDETRQKFKKYGEQIYPGTRNLYALHNLRNRDSLLIASENGLMYFSIRNKVWSPCLPEIFESRGIIGRYFLEGKESTIWICTEGGGLVRLNYENQNFEIIQKVFDISRNSRYVWKDGNLLWVATDNGIVVYNYTEDVVVNHILVDNIHQSNVCYSIQKDQTGDFWVTTNFGLLKIDPQNYSLQNYNLDNGLDFLEYNTASVLAEDDGTLIFGGVGGITKFNPTELKENLYSPDPIITSVLVNSGFINANDAKEYLFDHKKNHFTFSFTANNFSNQELNRFYYRVDGLIEDWVDNRYNHSVTFNSIPPGSYTFQVRSANSDGLWSLGTASFRFVIYPPWWTSWWFIILLIISSGLIIGFIVKKRLSNIRKKAELKQRIVETEMMALRAQMNPHFIFNCLNSIDAFIQSNDKYQATTYLNKFAKLLRNVLDSSKQNTVTFSKDFETLKLYLELEQLRHENKFTTQIHADGELMNDDFQVPPLLIQPYVENAILHGLKYRIDNNGTLKIFANKLNDKIRYIIEDNGVGRKVGKNGISKNRTSYGMQMTSDRLRYFNSEEVASVTITDLTENGQATGTRIEVLLNFR